MRIPTGLRIIVQAGRQWVNNQDSRLGAALAYYTLFSIAPLLVIATRIAGYIFGEDAARGEVARWLQDTLGKDAAEAVQELVKSAAQPVAGGLAAGLGLGFMVLAALGAFLHVRGALCTIWKLEPPHGNSILGVLLDYLLALIMVVCTGVLLLLSLAASMTVPILRNHMENQFPGNPIDWQMLELLTSVLFLTLVFAVIYRVLSGQRVTWRHVIYGSLVCSILFTIGKFGLGMYLVHTSTASMYGAAGSLVVFLIWVYYSSQILFLGAELIQARRTRHEWMNVNKKGEPGA